MQKYNYSNKPDFTLFYIGLTIAFFLLIFYFPPVRIRLDGIIALFYAFMLLPYRLIGFDGSDRFIEVANYLMTIPVEGMKELSYQQYFKALKVDAKPLILLSTLPVHFLILFYAFRRRREVSSKFSMPLKKYIKRRYGFLVKKGDTVETVIQKVKEIRKKRNVALNLIARQFENSKDRFQVFKRW